MCKLKLITVLVSGILGFPASNSFAADTGDAPDSYGLATHEVIDGAPQLGVLAPDNNDPIAGPFADGDDADAAADDEDGVFAFPVLVQNGKSYTTNVFVSNTSAATATLIGWVDFNHDGQFSADEAASETVPAGTSNQKFKLVWNDLHGITTDYFGSTFARFRVSSQALSASDANGAASDGEVEDYTLDILEDSDGDEVPNSEDLDNDNDGIPDIVETVGLDSDGDGTQDYLDVDSDNDSIPDFIEAGSNPAIPADSDGDGTPDYLDLDSNNDGMPDSQRLAGDDDGDGISNDVEGSGDADGDGILNSLDLDSDNDTIPDAVEAGPDATAPVDTDNDGVADFLDLDSDNDGAPDFREASSGEVNIHPLDTDFDGRVDGSQVFGANGIVDAIETQADSGIPVFAVADSDGDSVRDYLDTDSDNDGVADIIEIGGQDNDANGIVDGLQDADSDGIPDGVDVDITGGTDADADGIDDVADTDQAGTADADSDGIIDTFDIDANGDGFIDGTTNLFTEGREPFDLDDDNIPDYRDSDSAAVGDGNGTDGGTGNGDGGTTAGSTDNGESAILETGLSGFAGGCSVVGLYNSQDPLMFGLLVLSAGFFCWRRRKCRATFIRYFGESSQKSILQERPSAENLSLC